MKKDLIFDYVIPVLGFIVLIAYFFYVPIEFFDDSKLKVQDGEIHFTNTQFTFMLFGHFAVIYVLVIAITDWYKKKRSGINKLGIVLLISLGSNVAFSQTAELPSAISGTRVPKWDLPEIHREPVIKYEYYDNTKIYIPSINSLIYMINLEYKDWAKTMETFLPKNGISNGCDYYSSEKTGNDMVSETISKCPSNTILISWNDANSNISIMRDLAIELEPYFNEKLKDGEVVYKFKDSGRLYTVGISRDNTQNMGNVEMLYISYINIKQ